MHFKKTTLLTNKPKLIVEAVCMPSRAPFVRKHEEQNRSTEGWSKLKRSVDMTSLGKNGLNIRTNASPKWDRTRCPEE